MEVPKQNQTPLVSDITAKKKKKIQKDYYKLKCSRHPQNFQCLLTPNGTLRNDRVFLVFLLHQFWETTLPMGNGSFSFFTDTAAILLVLNVIKQPPPWSSKTVQILGVNLNKFLFPNPSPLI